jgi:plasmid maintenance system antidote protein VapI
MTDSSLIQAAAEADRAAPAFSFFSEEEREATERLAAAGEFTGERLFRDRPGIYSAIVRMAAEGLSISAAARALGVSRNTVVAVREREGISIEQDKRELMKLLGTARRLSVEKVIELIPDLKSAKDAAITAAVMVDKHALLAGEATSRVERVEVKADQVQAYLDALPVVEGEVLEVISTGIAAGAPEQKAAGPEGAASDLQSDVIGGANSVEAAGGTTCRTTEDLPRLPAPGAGEGGGGGAAFVEPYPGGMETETQNFGQRPKAEPAKALCKHIKKKQGGRAPASSLRKRVSKKAPITAKKKGGSAC